MFERKITLSDRLAHIFKRYTSPVPPYNHFNRTHHLLPLCPGLGDGKTEVRQFPNGQISVDNFSNGKDFTYEVSYTQDGTTFKSHFKMRLVNEDEANVKIAALNKAVERMNEQDKRYAPSEDNIKQNSVVVTSIMLDNEEQELRSPQEIETIVAYMGNHFTRCTPNKPLTFTSDKDHITGSKRKFMDRLTFQLKRGL
jgi:hypothetical protein